MVEAERVPQEVVAPAEQELVRVLQERQLNTVVAAAVTTEALPLEPRPVEEPLTTLLLWQTVVVEEQTVDQVHLMACLEDLEL